MSDDVTGGSRLLAALRRDEFALILPHLQSLSMPAGAVLHEAGERVEHAYFPRGPALASFLVLTADGDAVESALIGREGAVGGIVSQGHLPAFARCCVLQGGEFYRVPSLALNELKQKSPHMNHLFARYADCLIAQLFQTVACNARHSIEQRFAKWLSAALDRTGGDDIGLTQAQLGSLLGVGRSYVTRIVSRFKADGVIVTRRGGIRVVDKERLTDTSCECNRLVAQHFDTVLKGVYPNEER